MAFLNIIIISLAVGWWISTTDIAYSLGGIISTKTMRARMVFILLISVTLGGLFAINFSNILESHAKLTTPTSSLIVSVAAFIAVMSIYKLSKLSSICYGVMGAIFGWQLSMYKEVSYAYLIKTGISWILAPILVLLLSAILLQAFRKYMLKSEIHFIRLSYYLRVGIILSSVLLALAFGLNNGALLMLLNSTVHPNFDISFDVIPVNIEHLLLLFSILIILITTFWKAKKNSNNFALDSNLNTEHTLLITLSCAVVLLFFSIPACSNFIGLNPTPLSLSQLSFGGIVGIGLVSRHEQIDPVGIVKTLLSIFVVPLVAFAVSFFLFEIINEQKVAFNNNIIYSKQTINITIPLLVVVFTIVLSAVLYYFNSQSRTQAKTQKEALKNQKDLLENQKSLSALEVKAVVLENESLNTKLELKRQELINIALGISEQKTFLEQIYSELKSTKKLSSQGEKDKKIDEIERELMQRMSFSQEIESFYAEIEMLHKDFNLRLTQKHPNLTENEKRLIILLRLGFSTKHIASLMTISPKSVEIARYRLRKKLELQRGKKINQFLKEV